MTSVPFSELTVTFRNSATEHDIDGVAARDSEDKEVQK